MRYVNAGVWQGPVRVPLLSPKFISYTSFSVAQARSASDADSPPHKRTIRAKDKEYIKYMDVCMCKQSCPMDRRRTYHGYFAVFVKYNSFSVGLRTSQDQNHQLLTWYHIISCDICVHGPVLPFPRSESPASAALNVLSWLIPESFLTPNALQRKLVLHKVSVVFFFLSYQSFP